MPASVSVGDSGFYVGVTYGFGVLINSTCLWIVHRRSGPRSVSDDVMLYLFFPFSSVLYQQTIKWQVLFLLNSTSELIVI